MKLSFWNKFQKIVHFGKLNAFEVSIEMNRLDVDRRSQVFQLNARIAQIEQLNDKLDR